MYFLGFSLDMWLGFVSLGAFIIVMLVGAGVIPGGLKPHKGLAVTGVILAIIHVIARIITMR